MKQKGLLTILIVTIGLSNLCWAESAEDHFNRGQFYFKQQKYDAAIEAFEQALTADPDFSQAYLEMGFAYRLLGDFQKAITAYTNALALDPNDASAHLRLGEIHQLLNDPEAAEAEFAAYRNLTAVPSN